MIGAICGDIIGSRFEWDNCKSKEFELFTEVSRFTDDTVLTIAVADWLTSGDDLVPHLQRAVAQYPDAGYGGRFVAWAQSGSKEPYGSWGNGSAMRVAPVGWWAKSVDEVVALAEVSAAVSHNHPEGVKGARAIALSVFLARQGAGVVDIRSEVSGRFGYDLNRTVDQIRPRYTFDVSCAGSVPEAIIAVCEATDYEDAIRNAVSLGGDSDTIACMAGAIAEPLFGVPSWIREEGLKRLTVEMRVRVERFEAQCLRESAQLKPKQDKKHVISE